MESFEKRLKRLCKENGLTIAELARRSGVPKATLHSWTTGASPNMQQLKKVSSALSVSLHSLAFGEPDPHEYGAEKLQELFEGDIRVTVHKILRSRN